MGKKFARKVHDVPINCLSIGTPAGFDGQQFSYTQQLHSIMSITALTLTLTLLTLLTLTLNVKR